MTTFPSSASQSPARFRLMGFMSALALVVAFALLRHFDKPMFLAAIGLAVLAPWVLAAVRAKRSGRA